MRANMRDLPGLCFCMLAVCNTYFVTYVIHPVLNLTRPVCSLWLCAPN